MKIFDLSQPLFDECPNCPVHPPVRVLHTADHPVNGWRMEELHMASHSGTHLDAPLHKLAGGRSIDLFALEAFVGRPVVADLAAEVVPDQAIGVTELERAFEGQDLGGAIVLLHTGWGLRRKRGDDWWYRSPFLSPAGAEWLVARKVLGVGIDHFSIGGTREPDNAKTHEILMGAGVWIVEELCFREGWRDALDGAVFQALPLNLPGFSGSPCRAVLMRFL